MATCAEAFYVVAVVGLICVIFLGGWASPGQAGGVTVAGLLFFVFKCWVLLGLSMWAARTRRIAMLDESWRWCLPLSLTVGAAGEVWLLAGFSDSVFDSMGPLLFFAFAISALVTVGGRRREMSGEGLLRVHL